MLARGERVIGVDRVDDYYDVALKEARLARLAGPQFTFVRADVADREAMLGLASPEVTHIVHLAAQAGVRFSMIDPYAYVMSNVMGQVVMLELARAMPKLAHFVFASSSSVYGLNRELPFSEAARVDQPSSLYAATKRSGELISHAYSHLYGLPQTGLRFFTVYGPWGRPDMAYYGFARAIMAGQPITLYEGGRLRRDFTYIDDIVAGVVGSLDRPPNVDAAPRLLNIGNHRSEGGEHAGGFAGECAGAFGHYRGCGPARRGRRGDLGRYRHDQGPDWIFAKHDIGRRHSAFRRLVQDVSPHC